jgi:predicted nucleic acid-binding protein
VILVDSSGWIEYFTDGPLADEFAPYLENYAEVVTPTIVIFEVYRVIRRQRSEEEAIAAVAQMQKTSVVDLDQFLALSAAEAHHPRARNGRRRRLCHRTGQQHPDGHDRCPL